MKNSEQFYPKLERYCAYQDRCKTDVILKMKQLNIASDQHDSIIEKLVNEKFIDEQRYTCSYVRGHFKRKKWGKTKIRFSLYQKGIPESLVNKALKEEIDEESYNKTLTTLAQQKISSLKEKNSSTTQLKNKTFTYLNQKGYEIDLIHYVLNNLIK